MNTFYLKFNPLQTHSLLNSNLPEALCSVVAELAVEIGQVADQLRLALFGALFREPGVDQGMGLIVIEPVVRAAVQRYEQQGPGLFGPYGREHLLDRHELTLSFRGFAENRVGLQQQDIEFAAHDVGVECQATVFLQNLGGDSPVFSRPPPG